MGWQQLDDGELLKVMADEFDVLLTVDASIPFQHTIGNLNFGVVILRAKSNRVAELARLVPALLKSLKEIAPGELREIQLNQ